MIGCNLLGGQKFNEPLSEQEFYMYFEKYKNGDTSAKNKIIEHNFGLVKLTLESYFFYQKEEWNDLFQVGCIGLIKAIDEFNPDLNFKFSTFAVKVMKFEIHSYLYKNTTLKSSKRFREFTNKVMKLVNKYESKGISFSTKELAEKLNTTQDKIQQAIYSKKEVRSFSEVVSNLYDNSYKETSLEDTIADKNIFIDENLENEETYNDLYEGISILNNIEQRIIKELYLIDNPKTQNVLAQELGISQGCLSKINKKILEKLKTYIIKAYIPSNNYEEVNDINKLLGYFYKYDTCENEILSIIDTILNNTNKKLMELKYGLNGNPSLNNHEIAQQIDIKESLIPLRVCNIREMIKRKLEKNRLNTQNQKTLTKEIII